MGRRTHPAIQTLKGRAAAGALRLLGLLPFGLNRALANGLGRLLAVLPTEARRITRINLRLCLPDQPDREALARASFLEALKSGVTCVGVLDRGASALGDAARESGLRVVLADALAEADPVSAASGAAPKLDAAAGAAALEGALLEAEEREAARTAREAQRELLLQLLSVAHP